MENLVRPRSLEELMKALSAAPKHALVAGGTDWVVKNHGQIGVDLVIIDLAPVRELYGISLDGRALRIGAMETMTAINSDENVKKYATALCDAASVMGSLQIRNRATLGGNLANASAAADTPSTLAALGARAKILSPRGEKSITIEEALGSKPNSSALAADEVIVAFEIPVAGDRISAFKKIGSRSEVSIARLNLSMAAQPQDGAFTKALVFVGTLGSAARRCTAAEEALSLSAVERATALRKALAEFAEKSIPGRSTLPYKRSAIQALGLDVLALLEARAAGGKN
jgi:xanthine dehydrogenase FAD-binding subunit